MAKKEEGEIGGGEIGSEGGGTDLNFGIPPPPLLLNPLADFDASSAVASSPARSSAKDVVWVEEKEKAADEASKLPAEEDMETEGTRKEGEKGEFAC